MERPWELQFAIGFIDTGIRVACRYIDILALYSVDKYKAIV